MTTVAVITVFDDNGCSYHSVGIMPTFHHFSCDQFYSFKLWHFSAEPDIKMSIKNSRYDSALSFQNIEIFSWVEIISY